jgi:5-(carboxyamino)imidazole ribonucleotide synthase
MTTTRVGVIGSGQLGRMMALAGIPLDVEFVFFDEALTSPSSMLGQTIQPSSENALQVFLNSVDVVTYESENTDADLVANITKVKPVHPGENSLRKSQHRLTEKNNFRELGIQTADFLRVTSKQELITATEKLGLPIVLKTTTMGYDGKGQAVVKVVEDIDSAWEALKDNELIAEAFVTFSRELSVIAVRDTQGNTKVYPLAENDHTDGILRVSRVPAANLSNDKQQQATDYITTLLDSLNHVGVLTLELFDTENGLIANEMAPRVHNSGHWTIEGTPSSQFENHVRAICGMPLGCTDSRPNHAAMINIIGKHGDREKVLSMPNGFLHTYSKTERLNRKIGHINLMANTREELEASIKELAPFISECG